jgi:hypothetical protein
MHQNYIKLFGFRSDAVPYRSFINSDGDDVENLLRAPRITILLPPGSRIHTCSNMILKYDENFVIFVFHVVIFTVVQEVFLYFYLALNL